MEENEWISLYYEENEKAERLEQEKCELLGIIQGKDKAIAELEQKLEQTEKDLTDYQFNYPKIKDLEKENAELKEELRIATEYPEWAKTVKLVEEDCIKRLAEAKEIIKDLLSCARNYPEGNLEKMQRAEQFLKE